MERVHREVHERHAARAGVVEPEEAQHGALDGDGGVAPDELEHLRGDLVRERAAAIDDGAIEREVGDVAAVGEQHGGMD